MRIIFGDEDVRLVADAMAKSRRLTCDFDKPYGPDSTEAGIFEEALRVVAAFRSKYNS